MGVSVDDAFRRLAERQLSAVPPPPARADAPWGAPSPAPSSAVPPVLPETEAVSAAVLADPLRPFRPLRSFSARPDGPGGGNAGHGAPGFGADGGRKDGEEREASDPDDEAFLDGEAETGRWSPTAFEALSPELARTLGDAARDRAARPFDTVIVARSTMVNVLGDGASGGPPRGAESAGGAVPIPTTLRKPAKFAATAPSPLIDATALVSWDEFGVLDGDGGEDDAGFVFAPPPSADGGAADGREAVAPAVPSAEEKGAAAGDVPTPTIPPAWLVDAAEPAAGGPKGEAVAEPSGAAWPADGAKAANPVAADPVAENHMDEPEDALPEDDPAAYLPDDPPSGGPDPRAAGAAESDGETVVARIAPPPSSPSPLSSPDAASGDGAGGPDGRFPEPCADPAGGTDGERASESGFPAPRLFDFDDEDWTGALSDPDAIFAPAAPAAGTVAAPAPLPHEPPTPSVPDESTAAPAGDGGPDLEKLFMFDVPDEALASLAAAPEQAPEDTEADGNERVRPPSPPPSDIAIFDTLFGEPAQEAEPGGERPLDRPADEDNGVAEEADGARGGIPAIAPAASSGTPAAPLPADSVSGTAGGEGGWPTAGGPAPEAFGTGPIAIDGRRDAFPAVPAPLPSDTSVFEALHQALAAPGPDAAPDAGEPERPDSVPHPASASAFARSPDTADDPWRMSEPAPAFAPSAAGTGAAGHDRAPGFGNGAYMDPLLSWSGAVALPRPGSERSASDTFADLPEDVARLLNGDDTVQNAAPAEKTWLAESEAVWRQAAAATDGPVDGVASAPPASDPAFAEAAVGLPAAVANAEAPAAATSAFDGSSEPGDAPSGKPAGPVAMRVLDTELYENEASGFGTVDVPADAARHAHARRGGAAPAATEPAAAEDRAVPAPAPAAGPDTSMFESSSGWMFAPDGPAAERPGMEQPAPPGIPAAPADSPEGKAAEPSPQASGRTRSVPAPDQLLREILDAQHGRAEAAPLPDRLRLADIRVDTQAFAEPTGEHGDVDDEPFDEAAPVAYHRIRQVPRLGYLALPAQGALADAVRHLRARLLAVTARRPSVFLAGGERGVGRTEVACQLALALARRPDARVALVDGDFRRPGVARRLGLPVRTFGLADLLRGSCRLEDALVYCREDNLFVLPARPPDRDGDDLADGRRVAALMGRLHERFDYTVVDGGVVGADSGPLLFAPVAGCAAVVVRAGRSRPDRARRAARTLGQAGAEIAGAVLVGA